MRAFDEGERSRVSGPWLIWGIPLVLSLCGLVMIASLSLRNSMDGGEPYAQILKQARFFVFGLVLMVICALTPLKLLRRYGWILWIFSLLLVSLTLVSGIGIKVGGARRWLALGHVRFQPLELLLFSVPIFMADRLDRSRRSGRQAFLRPTLTVAFFSVLPLLFQPNLGGTILVTGICLMMHAERQGWSYPLLGGFLMATIFALLIWMEPYRMRRLMAFLDPWSDPMNKGFQIIQGLVAFCNGRIFGVGIGKGLQEDAYLPAAQTDYIFPAIGEEFGLVGTLLLLSLYAVWTIRIYRIYRRCTSPFLSALTLGLTTSVIGPMFVNLGGVMKLMPLTGIPLPFISAGGSAMIFMWAKVGILMRINGFLNREEARHASFEGMPRR
ncbi:FtsW/RodA/SpoVE family cell cycle protein [Fretibacterium sp. OH1220_COT-178]|uniref:FtsW/RodA/SpoVE family cell cycle protein n=1 Tax=Fretibacterium sp. OH1220_COT-178 TaxID=2491047 RepID=UPI000F5ED9BC|nr:putative peptidoglycan glycosyltransferase FtsW [Fretibacterium sp. OH1220_COT-178]RRD66289.1 cell division protein FtsW [Fretibacterium sp. OH1220_COT-178]